MRLSIASYIEPHHVERIRVRNLRIKVVYTGQKASDDRS